MNYRIPKYKGKAKWWPILNVDTLCCITGVHVCVKFNNSGTMLNISLILYTHMHMDIQSPWVFIVCLNLPRPSKMLFLFLVMKYQKVKKNEFYFFFIFNLSQWQFSIVFGFRVSLQKQLHISSNVCNHLMGSFKVLINVLFNTFLTTCLFNTTFSRCYLWGQLGFFIWKECGRW